MGAKWLPWRVSKDWWVMEEELAERLLAVMEAKGGMGFVEVGADFASQMRTGRLLIQERAEDCIGSRWHVYFGPRAGADTSARRKC